MTVTLISPCTLDWQGWEGWEGVKGSLNLKRPEDAAMGGHLFGCSLRSGEAADSHLSEWM